MDRETRLCLMAALLLPEVIKGNIANDTRNGREPDQWSREEAVRQAVLLERDVNHFHSEKGGGR